MSVFGRKVTVTMGQAGAPGVAVSGLHASFRVQMSQSSVPNTATIRLWNPNPVSVALLESGPLPTVGLSVGYSDPLQPADLSIPRQIFVGDVVKDGLTIRKEGPDRVVEIEAQDGGVAYQTGTVNLSFATPVSMSAVVVAIAAQLALPVGLISVVPDIVLPNGGVFSGSAREVLDRIAATVGGAWWISDGVFFFSPTTTPLALPAPLFSSFAGNLIGAPQKKDRGGVEVRALLDASLRPGGTFVLQSSSISGTYIASDVIFEGDSGFAAPFYVTTVGRLPGT